MSETDGDMTVPKMVPLNQQRCNFLTGAEKWYSGRSFEGEIESFRENIIKIDAVQLKVERKCLKIEQEILRLDQQLLEKGPRSILLKDEEDQEEQNEEHDSQEEKKLKKFRVAMRTLIKTISWITTTWLLLCETGRFQVK